IPMNIAAIRQSIIDVAHQYPKNRWRLRLTVNQEGKEEISIRPLEHVATQKVILAKEPINKNHLYVYHKTTNRLCYEEHQVKDESILDVLLWNDKQELTEFTIGNIVVEWNGELVTPPVSSGLLAGTFRNQLLNNGEIKEKVITKNNIRQCKNIWLINSVRQWVKVELV